MDKNKSIDGLKPRSEKTAVKTTKTSVPRKSSASVIQKPKTTSTKKTIKTKTSPISEPSTSPATPKPLKQPPKKLSSAEITEDFLKPIQIFDFDEQSGELKASKNSDPKSKPLKKGSLGKKKMSKKKKITLIIISVILSLILIVAICFVVWGNDIIAKITGGQGNVFDLIFQDETYEPLKTDENNRTNILAYGTSGYNMDGDEGNGTHDGAQLTDSIMVISLNQDTGDIAMLSLPRDLKASPTCTATGKINEVYWCNGGGGDISLEEEAKAAQALMDEVSDILGIDFQYFAHLNWGSLVSIVDTLGGINVTLDEDISDYTYTGAVFKADTEYTINGAEALGLARARHGTASGDFSRGASQQKILVGIKDKVFSKKLSISDLISLASTLGDNLRTNFSVDEMKTLAHLTANFDFNSMRQVSLIEPEQLMTTGNINGISYVIPTGGVGYYTKIQDYVEKMFSNDPRLYETYDILVLNATDITGLAANEQTKLEKDGYDNISVDGTPDDFTSSEEYILYSLSDSAPGTKKLLEEKYNVTANSAEELPVGISKDHTFVLILNPSSSETEEN